METRRKKIFSNKTAGIVLLAIFSIALMLYIFKIKNTSYEVILNNFNLVVYSVTAKDENLCTYIIRDSNAEEGSKDIVRVISKCGWANPNDTIVLTRGVNRKGGI